MNRINNENGFSLIEVLIALTVLLVIITAFSVLFSESFVGIFASGNKSEAQYILQDSIENEMGNIEKNVAEVDKTSLNVSGFSIEFSDNEDITVDGERIIFETTFDDGKDPEREVEITVFLSD